VGLRAGEKLYEELVGRDESVGPSHSEKILRVTSRSKPGRECIEGIRAIEQHAARGDVDATMAMLQQLIPEFRDRREAVATAAPTAAQVAVTTPELVEQHCPSCHSSRVHRSRARTVLERLRRDHGRERLFKCDDCGWRGWLLPLEFATPMSAPPAPDLEALDTVEGGRSLTRRAVFSPRNLL
jgi:hypothetical protein